jgi:Na+-transporting NADH:ubiquinone oxidoreductase subunit F
MGRNGKGRNRHGDYSLVGKDTARAIEQGLADAKWYASPIPREKLRELLERRDGPALRDTLLWFVLLLFFGGWGYVAWGSAWAILPFAIYGVLYASVSDSRWHESSHGTAFKTDWMNNALYELASFMVLRESVPWRWSHTRHHSDTLVVGRDPEIVAQRPANLLVLFLNLFNVMAVRSYVRTVFLHCLGRITPEERTYIPEAEYGRVFFRARLYVLIYVGVIALAISFHSLLPLMYVGLVSFYGAWLMPIYGYTQHAGLAENVLDHRLNCRTVYMNPINRFLYWNMGYHVEHHMFPLVPYHALPRLHALVKADMPVPYNGLLEAYREIIPALLRQAKDPDYYVQRTLPANPAAVANTSRLIRSAGQPDSDGWLEACDSALLEKEDVLRFDHGRRTYAIYRTQDGSVFATDGLCTHGNAHLAEGLLKGTVIECAKHNGRFDVRDGSPQRLPVCVGVSTYPVRENQGKLLINLTQAGGYGTTQAAVPHRFKVLSNRLVTPFIKELLLEPENGAATPAYQPGDYLQFDIPAYSERFLRDVEVEPTYARFWADENVFRLTVTNPAPCRRNYSIAGNPATESTLRFNIRLATPPRSAVGPAGIGSTYLFGLKPGDTVTAIGPFGQFHVKESQREMVYVGGGSGMAPLRSHLAYLLETQHTPAPISYWYGVRSLKELYYREYFEELARTHPNFSFQVALSEPSPEEHWTSFTGYIHEVLRREYLSRHADPKRIDYFLCGPPAMIKAATEMLAELGVPPAQIAFDDF